MSRPLPSWPTRALRDDGTVVDIVVYDTAEHAQAGAAGKMAGSPVHDTIGHRTVDWQMTTVLRVVEAAG